MPVKPTIDREVKAIWLSVQLRRYLCAKEAPATLPVGRRATFAFLWSGTFLIVRSGSFGNRE